MTGIRFAAITAVLASLASGGVAHAFTVTNNTNRTVYVTVHIFIQGYTEPDVVSSHWETRGWWKVAPGGVTNIPGGDGTCYARMTYDTIDGELVTPANPRGKPLNYLTHASKFTFSRSDTAALNYGLRIDDKYIPGQQTVESAAKYGCKIREGFYPYPADDHFRIGGEKPPAGTTRTISYNFEYRAGAMNVNTIRHEWFNIPAGATVVEYKVRETSSRGAAVVWTKEPNRVLLDGFVSGENKPFGAGGAYSGEVTITYRY